MKLWQSILIQSVLTAGQIVNIGMDHGAIPPIKPNAATPWVTLGLSVVQTILAGKAHKFNTDGTPQTVPYQPKVDNFPAMKGNNY